MKRFDKWNTNFTNVAKLYEDNVKIPKSKFYKELYEGTEDTFDFGDGKNVPAHEHEKGGGWVADSAWVDKTAYVGTDAKVYGKAKVLKTARVQDKAEVFDNAVVTDDCEIGGTSKVFGKAVVSGEAWIHGDSTVSDSAKVTDNAWVRNSKITGNKIVKGNEKIGIINEAEGSSKKGKGGKTVAEMIVWLKTQDPKALFSDVADRPSAKMK
jgi:carbonic anhydrase/acetyltransferase-like protein (isoleucine patch superfamily)